MDGPLVLPNNAKMGLKCLSQGAFYEAHEYFEDAWRQTMDDQREFYRALLHISGGLFRLQQGRANAARKFFNRALYWLEPFPNDHLGFDLVRIRGFVEILLKKIDNCTSTEIILESSRPIIHAIFSSNLANIS